MKNFVQLFFWAAQLAQAQNQPVVQQPPVAQRVVDPPSKAPEPPAPKRYLVASHSFGSPFSQDPSFPNWIFTDQIIPGSATPAGLTISSQLGKPFGIWNKVPLETNNFEVEIAFDIRIPPGSQGAEGVAIWLVSENPANLPGPAADWNLFGYSSRFSGLGVFMSMADRAGKLNPSISAAVSDTSKVWDPVKDIPSNDGIYYNFRNGVGFTIKVVSNGSSVTGFVKSGQGEYKTAFTLKNGRVYPGMFLGVTGSPYSQSVDHASQTLTDVIEIQSIQVINLDESKNSAVVAAVRKAAEKEELEKLANGDMLAANGDVNANVALLTKLLAKHIKENYNRDAEFNRMLHSFVSRQDSLSQSNEQIHSVLQSVKADGGSDQIHQELRGLKEEFQKAQSDKGRISGDPTVEELAARSASLEQTIKQHATFSSYLVGGFGVLVSCLGYFIWRRMKEMEKKHLL